MCVCVFQGGVGQQERAVFIQSVPCLNHVVGKTTGRLPVRSRRTQRPSERVEETGETERSRPQGWPREPASAESVSACRVHMCVLTELKNPLQGLGNGLRSENADVDASMSKSKTM